VNVCVCVMGRFKDRVSDRIYYSIKTITSMESPHKDSVCVL